MSENALSELLDKMIASVDKIIEILDKKDSMNRQIKFRGKSADGKWHYGDLRQFGKQDKDLMGKVGIYPVNDDDWRGCPIVDENSVGQFTGLTDRNGKEIYEGDILERYNEQGITMHINYFGSQFGCIQHWDGVDGEGSWYPLDNYCTEEWEVIGNIHDNKIQEEWE